jgi:hypothetical protein
MQNQKKKKTRRRKRKKQKKKKQSKAKQNKTTRLSMDWYQVGRLGVMNNNTICFPPVLQS